MAGGTIVLESWKCGAALSTLALLAACGGGSGGVTSTPQPTPTPTPAPAPAPTPAPTPPPSSFDTQEFQDSDGPDQHGAITAWEDGATGQGATIAIVDTGIDADSPEFAGRIHPDSRDVAANRGIEQEDDHGTNVALVAAAGRNDTGVLGIAFDADVLVLRADRPGTCGTDTPEDTSLGCSFLDSDIAAGIDQAVASGAAVINLSLGGGNPSQTVRDAVARASAAGVVIVVAAGNGGDGSTTGIDPNQPTNFAAGIRAVGGDNVIIVGSVDEADSLSSFSQRAGSEADWYLGARGERICCVYEDGEIFLGQDDQGQFQLLFAGTSFATPQVAGAVALLASAFPNLSGAEIVEILLDSARDAGAAGTDATYGRGVLDIAAAFAPSGATTMAGGTARVYLGTDTAVGSSAMGDAFAAGQDARGVVLDSYQRAYEYNFGAGLRGAVPQLRLHAALDANQRHVAAGNSVMSLAFTVADPGHDPQLGWNRQLQLTPEQAEGARVLAARVALTIDADTQMGVGVRESAHGVTAQLQGAEQPAFLIANAAGADKGFTGTSDMAFAMRREWGGVGLTASAESGEAWLGNVRRGADRFGGNRERYPTRSFALAADRTFGPIDTVFGLTWMQEDRTILGAYFDESFGAGGADTLFLDTQAAVDLVSGWRLGGAYRHGFTRAEREGLVSAGSNFASSAWSLDLSNRNVAVSGDRLAFRVSQPLRVRSGGINLTLPTAYDYATESTIFGQRSISLSPTGREMVGEMAWRAPLWAGSASASVYYRTQPGHYAEAPDDTGVALSWSRSF